MSIQYKEKTVLKKCEEAMQAPALFYTRRFVNYQGICPDAKTPYTELIAGYLMEHLAELTNGIPQIRREASYYTPSHNGKFDPNSPRTEEITAMKMFNHCKDGKQYAKLGTILDYQTPLKNKRSDVAGKIDLLAYDGSVLRILELKKPDTPETMLRCVLEGYTYLRTVDTAKLIEDFNKKDGTNIPEETPVKASPLVFAGSLPHREHLEDRPKLKALMKLLDSEPFFVREVPGGYEIL